MNDIRVGHVTCYTDEIEALRSLGKGSMLPTKRLFDHDSTTMIYSNSLLFGEAGSLINCR
jgi:hypothetical protein